MNTIGWIGSLLLAVCAVPQALKTMEEKTCSFSPLTLQLWFWGEVFTLVYVTYQMDYPLIFNMVVNLLCVSVLLYYNERKAGQ